MAKPKLTNADFCRASKTIRCEVAQIKAVAEVESRGEGFYADGFPVILFERHKFRSFTNGRFNKSHPHLSGPPGNYGKAGQNQRNKFNEAFALAPEAAMKSCSWGKFQIMGFNHEVCGYRTVGAFVDAMKESEGKQLDAFVSFVIGNGLADELRGGKWAAFARSYNGADYAKNKYDTKMAAAYNKFAKENIDCSKVSTAPPQASASTHEVQPADDTVKEQATNEPSIIPVPLVVEPTPVIEVQQIAPQPVEEVKPEKEDVLTRIGNKAVALWTAAGVVITAIGTFLSSLPWEFVALIVGAVVGLGGIWMFINWRRNENKDKRDHELKLERERLDADLKAKNAQHIAEYQLYAMKSAAEKNLNAVTIAPPPAVVVQGETTEVPQ